MTPALPSSSSSGSNAAHFFAILSCLLMTSLVITKVISEKYFLFLGTPVSSRDIIYPLTFLIINIAAELYTPQQARMLITYGLIISIIVSMLLWAAGQLPIAVSSPISATDFKKVLSTSLSKTMGLLGAYLAGQFSNLYLFVWLSQRLNGRHLWLRSTIASLCAQFVDTALLVTTLYVLGATLEGQIPAFSNVLSQYAFKAFVTLISTLFAYLSVALWPTTRLQNT